MGFLISIAFILGYQLENYGATAAGFAGKGKILLFSALLMIPVGAVVYLLYLAAEKWQIIMIELILQAQRHGHVTTGCEVLLLKTV